ncbi:MAG: flavodoxin [Treponemataceae bacterium]|nr:flavodoxin [Treponemataceae bacterium]
MKIAIVYATTTGNTETMATTIKEALAGNDVYYSAADSADPAAVLACDVILLGSPAMGDEVLEDSAESFFSNIEGSISGKKVALFGSYDWGDGKWLADWEDRVKSCGAVIAAESLKVHLTPEDDDIAKCKDFAAAAIK